MFGLPQLEGEKKKKKSEAAQSKDVHTDDVRQGFSFQRHARELRSLFESWQSCREK